jgi:hypothetical protein
MIEVAEELVDRAEIQDGRVLVEYSKTEAALAELRERFAGAKFDLTTTAGDKAARAARLELVTLRTALEKKRKAFKEPALEFGKLIDAEARRITAEIVKLEEPIDVAIRADEARREAEREAKRQAEAARIQKHRDGIERINAYVGLAQGLPSERISKGIAALQAMEFSTDWEEFRDEAIAARDSTFVALQALYARTKAAEDGAARLEAQRQEQVRIAAEQKAEADRLAAERAAVEKELAAQRAEVERLRKELERQQAEIIAVAETERPTEPTTLVLTTGEQAEEPALECASAPVWEDLSQGGWQDESCAPPAPPQWLVDVNSLCDHVASAFKNTKFPRQPKPSPEWWQQLRDLGEAARASIN